jgi:hypothetical protein
MIKTHAASRVQNLRAIWCFIFKYSSIIVFLDPDTIGAFYGVFRERKKSKRSLKRAYFTLGRVGTLIGSLEYFVE